MSAVALGVATALVALRCQLVSDDPYVLGSVSRVIPATRPAFLRALNETRRLIGCPPAGDPQPPPPDFTGGQCPGVNYLATASGTNAQGNSVSAVRIGPGPVGGMCFGPLNQFGNTPVGITFADGCTFAGGGAGNTQPQRQNTWSVTGVSRVDGQPDDCGDPQPTYPPPINFNTNIDVTYNIDDGTEVTVNIPFVFAPITANFDGTLRIPLSFDLGGFTFNGNLSLPDFNLTINPPAVPPGSGENLDPVGEDEPGETVPPLPLEEKIIGVVVNSAIAQPGKVGAIDFGSAPDIIVPRAASVKFAYSIGAATFWSSDIDVKTLRAFVPCPFSQGADAAVVTPYIGLESTSVEIRGFPLATTNDVRQPA